MTDIELVIKIPKYIYDTVIASDGYIADCDNEKVGMAVKKGIPLPKGHGRLIDAEVFTHNVVKYSHQSTKTIGQALSDTPTIIEADNGESEG